MINKASLVCFVCVSLLSLIIALSFKKRRMRTHVERVFIAFLFGVLFWPLFHGISYMVDVHTGIYLFNLGSIAGGLGLYCAIFFIEYITYARVRTWVRSLANLLLGADLYALLTGIPLYEDYGSYHIFYANPLQRIAVSLLLLFTVYEIIVSIIAYMRTGLHGRKAGYMFGISLSVGLLGSMITIASRIFIIPETDKLPAIIGAIIIGGTMLAYPAVPYLVAQRVSMIAVINAKSGVPRLIASKESDEIFILYASASSAIHSIYEKFVGERGTEVIISGKEGAIIIQRKGEFLFFLATPMPTTVLKLSLSEFAERYDPKKEYDEEELRKLMTNVFPFIDIKRWKITTESE